MVCEVVPVALRVPAVDCASYQETESEADFSPRTPRTIFARPRKPARSAAAADGACHTTSGPVQVPETPSSESMVAIGSIIEAPTPTRIRARVTRARYLSLSREDLTRHDVGGATTARTHSATCTCWLVLYRMRDERESRDELVELVCENLSSPVSGVRLNTARARVCGIGHRVRLVPERA